MPPYEQFSLGDFVTDEYFLDSCLRDAPSSRRFWDEWLAAHPSRRKTWEEARAVVLALADGKRNYALVRLPEDKVDALWERISQTVATGGQSGEEPQRVRSVPLWSRLAAACAALLALVGGYLWLSGLPQQPLAAGDLDEFVELASTPLLRISNDGKVPQPHRLSDGSTVVLHPGSELLYPDSFGAEDRTVHLVGNAEFDIAHRPERPFMVYAGQLVARVLGTRFRVYTQDGRSEVSVLAGKVSVSRRKGFDKTKLNNAVVLQPNQHVSLDPEKGELLKSIVEAPVLLRPPTAPQALVFDETPVREVFDTLELAYGLAIVYDETTLDHCTLTATLTDKPFLVQLGLICETINARYEIVDGQVVITGSGCI